MCVKFRINVSTGMSRLLSLAEAFPKNSTLHSHAGVDGARRREEMLTSELSSVTLDVSEMIINSTVTSEKEVTIKASAEALSTPCSTSFRLSTSVKLETSVLAAAAFATSCEACITEAVRLYRISQVVASRRPDDCTIASVMLDSLTPSKSARPDFTAAASCCSVIPSTVTERLPATCASTESWQTSAKYTLKWLTSGALGGVHVTVPPKS
mmetsp:Transcript_35614/g.85345  ORF Transcript_35614/g.85345 Transcript_35614/m.85345 type:complete len:211 (+) Transcript_35614:478-1110(+)